MLIAPPQRAKHGVDDGIHLLHVRNMRAVVNVIPHPSAFKALLCFALSTRANPWGLGYT
jgi:hypothetical protein